jgi:trimethylamine:corrinoid methyltransferase-like protein
VLGPLPALHRLLVVGVVLVVGVCAGAWIVHFTPLEVAAPAGALIGAVAGVLAGVALVHDFSPGRHVRQRRRS